VRVFTVQAELADHHVSHAETSARMLLEPQAISFFSAFDGAYQPIEWTIGPHPVEPFGP